MTFDVDHYVPVLKVKRGEKKALQAVLPSIRSRITPLLEIVERNPEKVATSAAHIATSFENLFGAARLYARCFLDTCEIASDGPSAAAAVFDHARADGINFTPVTGISRSSDVAAALAHRDSGVAIRLSRHEFEAGLIPKGLPIFLSRHWLAPDQVDLIVDLGAVDQLIVDGVIRLTELFLADVPHHRRWRTLILSGCGFPAGMGSVAGSHQVDRVEWTAWRDALHAGRNGLTRLPTFSDAAIQHPKGVEGFDPRIMPLSAGIRYTLADSWLLIKGVSAKKVPLRDQFPDLAALLVNGDLKHHFSGSAHCEGCRLMAAAADGVAGIGSLEVWRRLGTIHHLTRTVEGLRSLPSP